VKACRIQAFTRIDQALGEGVTLDGTTLSTVASAVLSLGFSYVPRLRNWYDKLGVNTDGSDDGGTKKRLVMLILLVMVVLVVFGLSCAGLGAGFELNVTCDQPGAIGLVKALVFAIAANQGTYMLTKRSKRRPVGGQRSAEQIEFPF
jgi:hypothetical protein